jgi:hypothetical protein
MRDARFLGRLGLRRDTSPAAVASSAAVGASASPHSTPDAQLTRPDTLASGNMRENERKKKPTPKQLCWALGVAAAAHTFAHPSRSSLLMASLRSGTQECSTVGACSSMYFVRAYCTRR